MTTKILLITLMLLLPSIASSCNCNDSWMVGRHAIIQIADIDDRQYDDGNWYNVTILEEEYNFVRVSGISLNRIGYWKTYDNLDSIWVNKNFIWTISGL